MGHWNECNIEATTKVRDHVSVKELIQVHKIESGIKVINSVSDNGLLGIR